MAITDKKISIIYPGRDISSLSDRPNQDGMTASQLKARFDQLGKEVIPKLNALIDELFADLYSGTSQDGHTHNLDNLVDGITYKLFTALERAKLSAIAENAEVNQNAFSNVKVGSTTIASSAKTDTFELVAGLNVSIAVDSLTKKITLSATGDLATEAVQSYIEDIGNYFTSLNVEGALQEVGAKLSPSDSKTTPVNADTLLISDSADLSIFKKLSWANFKATLKTYFDTLYQSVLVSGTNIKTINGATILDSGNLELAPQATTYTKDEVDTQVGLLAPKANPVFTGTQTLPNIVTNGIKFPAVQVPSADPNTLDDYEEGTFTPVIRGETTAGTATYTTQQGIYTKIGRIVHFQIYLNWSSLTGTGAMIITGLPFANGSVIGAVTVSYPNLIALPAGGVMTAHVGGSAIYLTSYPNGGGGISFIQCDASGELILSGTYMV